MIITAFLILIIHFMKNKSVFISSLFSFFIISSCYADTSSEPNTPEQIRCLVLAKCERSSDPLLCEHLCLKSPGEVATTVPKQEELDKLDVDDAMRGIELRRGPKDGPGACTSLYCCQCEGSGVGRESRQPCSEKGWGQSISMKEGERLSCVEMMNNATWNRKEEWCTIVHSSSLCGMGTWPPQNGN